jgi:hypothetical protein
MLTIASTNEPIKTRCKRSNQALVVDAAGLGHRQELRIPQAEHAAQTGHRQDDGQSAADPTGSQAAFFPRRLQFPAKLGQRSLLVGEMLAVILSWFGDRYH